MMKMRTCQFLETPGELSFTAFPIRSRNESSIESRMGESRTKTFNRSVLIGVAKNGKPGNT
jgi:hypothetical protein